MKRKGLTGILAATVLCLAQYMRNYAGVKVIAVSTGGSKVNIQSVQDGDYQLGFAQSDVMTYAWNGYCFAEMSVIIRIVIAVGGLLLIYPALATDAVGLVCVAACLVYQMSIGGRLRKGRNE